MFKEKLKQILGLTAFDIESILELHKTVIRIHYDVWWGSYWDCGCSGTMEDSYTCTFHSILNLLEVDYKFPKNDAPSRDIKCNNKGCSYYRCKDYGCED